VRKVEGSNLVFRAGEGPWLKICPPFWPDAFDAEIRVTKAVQGRLPARVPAIIETGELEDWRYLVTAHVPGIQIEEVLESLDEADLERIAAELGQFMRAFHAVAVPGFERPFGPFRGRRGPQRRLMAEAGVSDPDGSFSVLFMAVALQHRFMHFDDWFAPEIAAGRTDIGDIARDAFPE